MSSFLSAGSSVISGVEKYNQSRYNASIAESNAQNAQITGQTNAYLEQQKGNRKIGAIQAAYGATGVKDSGTPLSVLADQAMQNHLATTMDKYNAATKAYNYRSKAKNERMAGNTALTTGVLKGASTLANHFQAAAGGL